MQVGHTHRKAQVIQSEAVEVVYRADTADDRSQTPVDTGSFAVRVD